jgi:hypothetical protein
MASQSEPHSSSQSSFSRYSSLRRRTTFPNSHFEGVFNPRGCQILSRQIKKQQFWSSLQSQYFGRTQVCQHRDGHVSRKIPLWCIVRELTFEEMVESSTYLWKLALFQSSDNLQMVISVGGVLTIYRLRRSVADSSSAIDSGPSRKINPISGYGSIILLVPHFDAMTTQ